MKGSPEVRAMVQAMVEKIVSDYMPQKVIVFGSYVYGTLHRDSDIDLLIVKDTPERFLDRWVAVRHILSDPTRTVPLETLVLTPEEVDRRLAIGDQFVAEILEKGEVLYASA